MAGIAGATASASTDLIERMLKTIEHRGVDGVVAHQSGPVRAGVCAPKLSDARGDGFARDGDVAVLFDGEIYNQRGAGACDATVALTLYKEYGRAFAAHLQGVFACAVIDGDDVILARDAVGVRPMYWGAVDGGLAFASELKALVGVSDAVNELPPGTTYSTVSGLAGFTPQYPPVTVRDDLAEATAAVRRAMISAVERRLDDGAVGACLLSGGLDSSIIAAAAKHLGADIPLITVGMEGAPDVENARVMAEHLGMTHEVFLYESDQILESVPRAVRTLESFDEDCVSGAISNLFASAVAGKHTNCILSGEGGDELFGGYHLLKDLPAEADKLRMMERLVAIAYNTAVQRLDRSMMGNGITYRTPFIDTEVIALATHLPVRWKIFDGGDGKLIEKHILREAFRDLLPDTIYRRVKLRFAAGTGTDDRMDEVAAAHGGVEGFNEASRKTPGGYTLNSPKEMWYYNLFKESFPAPCFESLVGRWDPGK